MGILDVIVIHYFKSMAKTYISLSFLRKKFSEPLPFALTFLDNHGHILVQ